MSANLDLLRALAVLMVLAQHLLRRAELLSVGPIPVETIGHFGVLLFFVHTSLVLMYSMHRACDRDAKELVRSFYIRRLFRIYPLSTVAIVAALALGVTSMGPVHGLAVTARPNLVAVSSDLLMVQNVTQVGWGPLGAGLTLSNHCRTQGNCCGELIPALRPLAWPMGCSLCML